MTKVLNTVCIRIVPTAGVLECKFNVLGLTHASIPKTNRIEK